MIGHHGHGGAFGLFAIVAAIAFAFGPRVARVVVGSGLIAGVVAFTYVMVRIVMGAI